MKQFNKKEYSDGSYSIGELSSDNYISGLGYTYWADTHRFAMGEFLHGAGNGWVCTNGATESDEDTIYFNNITQGNMTEGICLISAKNYLSIYQTTKQGEYKGYSFHIWPDGSWGYYYENDEKTTRAVEYSGTDQVIRMSYKEKGEYVWHKEILQNELKNDFRIPFHHFSKKTTPCSSFNINGENGFVSPKNGTGPTMLSADGRTSIGWAENEQLNGLLYTTDDQNVAICEMSDGDMDGAYFTIDKNSYETIYTYFEKGTKLPIEVYFDTNGDSIYISSHIYDKQTTFDSLSIDEDFNVKYLEKFDSEAEESLNSYECNFDDVYNSKDDEQEEAVEEEKPTKTKTSSSKTSSSRHKK